MPTAVWVDGAIGGAGAGVPALDAGFLYGDSIFETMRAARDRVIDLEAHLDRLEAGARALALEAPPRDELRAAIAETLAAAAEADLRVRAIVTRGRTDDAAARPLLVITAEPCGPLEARPIALALVDRPLTDPRTLDPALKTGSYLPNRLALRDARARAADEALRLTPAGAVASGATANLFAVVDGALITPPASHGVRAGVTRARVTELARGLGIDVIERAIAPGELLAADEVFATSSIRGVAPIWRIVDLRGASVDWPAPGPATQKIAEAYRGFATRGAG